MAINMNLCTFIGHKYRFRNKAFRCVRCSKLDPSWVLAQAIVEDEKDWMPLYEHKILKRKPKRVDWIIPEGFENQFDCLPLNKWIYFAQGNRYWKVKLGGKKIKKKDV